MEYLASRVGVIGFRHRIPPKPDPKASIRFAIFLSQHIAWIADDDIATWLRFLDDYIEELDEQNVFYNYLEHGPTKKMNPKRSARFQKLTRGIYKFLVYLSDLFSIVEPDERELIGLYYSYWMAKFFGFELRRKGYVRNKLIWENGESWAAVVSESPIFIPLQLSRDDRKLYSDTIRRHVEIIADTFEVAKSLVSTSNDTATYETVTEAIVLPKKDEPEIAAE